ncbi:class F sortase [Plantactinospora sp. GCM10030261]|uniref:class F sortase n=1 Tax=Plantactinospora sp. GCM10030261 TaxID=3273420 RepID=UPI0036236914
MSGLVRSRPDRIRPVSLAVGAAGLLLCVATGTGLGVAGVPEAAPPAVWQPACVAMCEPGIAQSTGVGGHRAGPPQRVRVPRLGVDSPLAPLGLDGTGRLVPPAAYDQAGWYAGGPVPGATGPAIIAGHLDSLSGPAVFARIDELRGGDVIEVHGATGSISFRVTAVERYAKESFGTDAVYGPTPGPELRLVTCGGTFDERTRHYRDNVVVFAVAESAAPVFPPSAAG